MKASKVIMWVIASPFILIAGGIAFCEANKAYWDHQVKLMCEKDGGVTVYEKVELTKEEYEKLSIPFERNVKVDSLYYRASIAESVIHNRPRVWEGGQTILRRSDGKTLGKQTVFYRSGGDFPFTASNQTSFGCGQIKGLNMNLDKSIFTHNGE